MRTTSLPEGFEQLEPLVGDWAIEGLANRARRRDESTAEERMGLYMAVKDVAEKILDHLDSKAPEDFDARERRLMALLLSFVQIALAVEIQGDAESRHAMVRPAMRITRDF
jgi:hypothetical protein